MPPVKGETQRDKASRLRANAALLNEKASWHRVSTVLKANPIQVLPGRARARNVQLARRRACYARAQGACGHVGPYRQVCRCVHGRPRAPWHLRGGGSGGLGVGWVGQSPGGGGWPTQELGGRGGSGKGGRRAKGAQERPKSPKLPPRAPKRPRRRQDAPNTTLHAHHSPPPIGPSWRIVGPPPDPPLPP